MKYTILITIFLCFVLHFSSLAQVNLVPNYSFEDTVHCPFMPGQIYYALHWSSPNGGTTDLLNSCALISSNISVPSNVEGYQLARTGNGYASIVTHYNGSDGREYLQTKLDSTLLPLHKYCVKFYVSLCDTQKIACNNIGIYFSDTAIQSTNQLPFYVSPQIVNNIITNPLTNKINWTEVSGSFLATGGEQYITIGNFLNDANSDTTHVAGGGFVGSVYYIDDVGVVDCTYDGVDEMGEGGLKVKIMPNPNDGEMTLKYTINRSKNAYLIIYDVTGVLIKKYPLQSGENNTLIIHETELSNGVYYYKVIIDDEVKSSDKIIIIK